MAFRSIQGMTGFAEVWSGLARPAPVLANQPGVSL